MSETISIFSQHPRATTIAGAVVLAGVLAACTTGNNAKPVEPTPTTAIQTTSAPSGQIDLLTGTWRYMPGATQTADGLSIKHTGEALLTFPDDTQPNYAQASYIPNPPMNTYGTHLEMPSSGKVAIKAALTGVKGAATLSFMDRPTIRYDERLSKQPSLDVTIDGAQVHIASITQADTAPQTQTVALPSSKDTHDIEITEANGQTEVAVDGIKTVISAAPLDKQVWFGMDTTESFKVASFTAQPLNGTTLRAVDTSKLPGQATKSATGPAGILASQKSTKLFGTAVDLPVLMSNPEYAKFVVGNSNEIETETLAKFQALQPEEGNYQFGELDALMDYAAKNNLKITGHALIFNEALPAWAAQKLESASPAEARALMTSYIQAVVSRYDGKHGHGSIDYWDVVNEPFDPDNFGQLNPNNIWYKTVGPDYIEVALRAAHAANPRAQLGINEFAIETDEDQWQGTSDLVDKLRAQNVPLNYIGIQAHFDEDTLNDSDAMDQVYGDELAGRLQSLADRGIKFRFSEVSVAENGNPAEKAKVYGRLAQLCEQAPNCTGLNAWGLVNGDYYFTADGGDPGNDAVATQSDRFAPVVPGPSWLALINAFKQN